MRGGLDFVVTVSADGDRARVVVEHVRIQRG